MDDIYNRTYYARRVVKTITHPDYAKNFKRSLKYNDMLGDLALLVLNAPVPFSWPVLQLPNAHTKISKKLLTLGYGTTSEGYADNNNLLRKVQLDSIDRNKCDKLLNKIVSIVVYPRNTPRLL